MKKWELEKKTKNELIDLYLRLEDVSEKQGIMLKTSDREKEKAKKLNENLVQENKQINVLKNEKNVLQKKINMIKDPTKQIEALNLAHKFELNEKIQLITKLGGTIDSLFALSKDTIAGTRITLNLADNGYHSLHKEMLEYLPKKLGREDDK